MNFGMMRSLSKDDWIGDTRGFMIPEKNMQDPAEDFFQILLIWILNSLSCRDNPEKNLREILQNWGIILKSSDLLILDNSRIGSISITIARYSLDYVHKADATEKMVCIEGSVAIETDEFGNRLIYISSKTNSKWFNFEISSSEMSIIASKM